MKQTSTLVAVMLLISSYAFTPVHSSEIAPSVAGKYGVCALTEAESKACSVELTLNTDNTFTYFDHSDEANKIDVSGKWTLQEGDVVLTDYPAGVKIHRIWKTDKDTPCLKSRKGTTFYRLCRIGDVVTR